MSWRDFDVSNPDEVEVLEALDGPLVTWRTLGGLSRATGLPATRVSEIVDKYDGKLTVRSEALSVMGQPFVGLVEKVGS